LLIIGTAFSTIVVVVLTLYLIAQRISKPIQKLNHAALNIAAGQYGNSIQVRGPKEIAELANTLSTMSECLLENINRLKENASLQEQLYGEYESAMLLQHLMLQKNIDSCRSDAVAIKPISFFSENPKGFLVEFPKTNSSCCFAVQIAESSNEGFEGMYQLLTQRSWSKGTVSGTTLQITQDDEQTLQWKGPFAPFVWSLEEERLITTENPRVDPGDFFFLCNEGLTCFYRERKKIEELLTKILKVFASDGLDTVSAMLQKEIAFAVKRKDPRDDIHLLAFQMLIPSK
jgi:HAMP domain-containing protein